MLSFREALDPGRAPTVPRMLHYMCQFMGDKQTPLVRLRRKPAGAEYNIVTYRICTGVDTLRRLSGSRAGMYPHAGKVVAKARLHEGARAGIQLLSRRS